MPVAAPQAITPAHRLQYVAMRAAAAALTCFDVDANLDSAAFFGRCLYRFDKRHRDRAAANIRAAFPEFDEARVQRVARDSFEHFVQLAVEVLHTPRLLTPDAWPRHLSVGNIGPALELLNQRKPCLMLTGHLGKWEVLGFLMALLGYRVHALARPLDNPLVYRWLLSVRELRGLRVITKWDATDAMLDVLGRGEALAFIADQNAGDKGLFVPFFGRLASTYKSIGLLALSQNVPIVCGYAHRARPVGHTPAGAPWRASAFHYQLGTVDVIRPEDWADQPDPLFYITARYSRAIESAIRRAPAQYLWMHRRFKSRPRWEREGKPLPAAYRRKLEALPWLNDEDIDDIAQPLVSR